MWKCAQDLFGLKSNKIFEPQAYERSFEGIDLWPAQSSLRKRALVKFGVAFSCFCPDPFVVYFFFSNRVAEPFDYSVLENWLHGVTLRRPKFVRSNNVVVKKSGGQHVCCCTCCSRWVLMATTLAELFCMHPFCRAVWCFVFAYLDMLHKNPRWCPAFVSISSYSHRTHKPHVGNPPTITKLNASSWRNCDQIHPIES